MAQREKSITDLLNFLMITLLTSANLMQKWRKIMFKWFVENQVDHGCVYLFPKLFQTIKISCSHTLCLQYEWPALVEKMLEYQQVLQMDLVLNDLKHRNCMFEIWNITNHKKKI